MTASLSRKEIAELCKKSRKTGALTIQGAEMKRIPNAMIHPFDSLEDGESSQYVVLLTRLNLQV